MALDLECSFFAIESDIDSRGRLGYISSNCARTWCLLETVQDQSADSIGDSRPVLAPISGRRARSRDDTSEIFSASPFNRWTGRRERASGCIAQREYANRINPPGNDARRSGCQ